MRTASARFFEWLTFRGLSQEAAAKLLKCSQATISNLCKGPSGAIGLALAVRIQQETTGWADGPIAASEWVPSVSSLPPSNDNLSPPGVTEQGER